MKPCPPPLIHGDSNNVATVSGQGTAGVALMLPWRSGAESAPGEALWGIGGRREAASPSFCDFRAVRGPGRGPGRL
jgi:hypothetical protein